MKGLLIKDFYVLKKQLYVVGALMLFYLFYSISLKSPTMIGVAIILVSFLIPVTSLAYDDQSKWNQYALSLPMTRKTIVQSKYLLGAITTLLGVAFCAVGNVIILSLGSEMDAQTTWTVTVIYAEIGCLMNALFLPVLLKFGAEKGRFILLAAVLVPSMLGGFFVSWLKDADIVMPSADTLMKIFYLSPVIVILLYILSYFLSLSILRKKEY